MESVEYRILQAVGSSPKNGINDRQIAEQLEIELDEIRFHLDDLYRGGFIELIKAKSFQSECYHASEVTPLGKMVLQGKRSLKDRVDFSRNSQIFNIANSAPVASQQFGNNNTANVTQNIGLEADKILQMLETIKQFVSSLPLENQSEALEALEDIREEVLAPKKGSRIKGALLMLWSIAKDVASFANAVTALAERFGMSHLLS